MNTNNESPLSSVPLDSTESPVQNDALVNLATWFRDLDLSDAEDSTPLPKHRILAAAFEIFATSGFHGASVREIAKKSEVNGAMIHYYFGSKEELYKSVIVSQFRTFFKTIREKVEQPGGLPVKTAGDFVFHFPQLVHDVLQMHPMWARLVLREIAEGGKYLEQAFQIIAPFSHFGVGKRLLEIRSAAISEQRIREITPEQFLPLMIGYAYAVEFTAPLFRIVSKQLGREVTDDERIEVMRNVFMHGIAAKSVGENNE